MPDRSVRHATFSIERKYDAPPQHVWRAWALEALGRTLAGAGTTA